MSEKTKKELDRIAEKYGLRRIAKPKSGGERYRMSLCLTFDVNDDLLADLDKLPYKKIIVTIFNNACEDAVKKKLKIKRM